MLEFVNTFFALMRDFVSMLFGFELLAGVSFGEFLVAVLVLSLVLSFLFKGWINSTFSK